MKKILVTGFTANRGGVEAFLASQIQALYKAGSDLQFDVLCYEKEPAFADEIRACNGKIYTVPSPKHPGSAKALEQFFKTHGGEYAALWCNKCDLSNIQYLKLAKKYNIPKRIIHSHSSSNMHTGLRRIVYGILHRWNRLQIHHWATDFWACSDYAARWFYSKSIQSSPQYCFIPNAIDLAAYKCDPAVRQQKRSQLGLDSDCLLVGHVGRFSHQKNHDFLLQIFSSIHAKQPSSKLLLIGEGERMEQVRAQIAQLGLEEAVIMLGKSSEVAQWMQAMDCFVLPSHFEGLPVVAVEAQATGLPVFAAQEGITPQTKLLVQFYFLSLQESASSWADKILNTNLQRVDNASQLVAQAGFEVNKAAQQLQKYLFN